MSKKKNQPSFCDQLADKLSESKIGTVNVDQFDDNSAKWIALRIDGCELVISFDGKGNKIDGINLYQDVIGVVDNKNIWGGRK